LLVGGLLLSFPSCTWERPYGISFAWAVQASEGGKINPSVGKAKLCTKLGSQAQLGNQKKIKERTFEKQFGGYGGTEVGCH
jgi:hypothetical protein